MVGLTREDVTLDMLGRARKVVVTMDETTASAIALQIGRCPTAVTLTPAVHQRSRAPTTIMPSTTRPA
jgi:hypothetical protein